MPGPFIEREIQNIVIDSFSYNLSAHTFQWAVTDIKPNNSGSKPGVAKSRSRSDLSSSEKIVLGPA